MPTDALFAFGILKLTSRMFAYQQEVFRTLKRVIDWTSADDKLVRIAWWPVSACCFVLRSEGAALLQRANATIQTSTDARCTFRCRAKKSRSGMSRESQH